MLCPTARMCEKACSACGSALSWDAEKRRPKLDNDACLSCMVCSFVCPVTGLINFREMPDSWKRKPTVTMG